MAEWLSGDRRVRLFLGLLILVLVVVNAQSLQVSHQSRNLLEASFRETVRARAGEAASRIARWLPAGLDRSTLLKLSPQFADLAREEGVRSVCVLDWSGRLLTGAEACPPSAGGDFDRLDRRGRLALAEEGWAVTTPSPAYDPERASAFGYRILPTMEGGGQVVVRVEVPASDLATANRSTRATLIYQVSALALVLLTVIVFLNSLLAPHRRLVAEARSVAGDLDRHVVGQDESQFLLSTFQTIVAQLKEKERELAEMHLREKLRADETEALATDIIRSMTTGLVSLDRAGVVVLANPAAERIFGLDSASVVGRPFAEVFPGSEELAGWVEQALSRAAVTGRRRVAYQQAGGNTIHLGVSVIPLLASSGEVRGALWLHADLTEVIQLRERLFLRENLARLGEMAAGIAHEFRNSLATILGNAKLLRGAASSPEAAELVGALLEETGALTHVVAEFLQFARPESLKLESVDLSRLVEELGEELGGRAREAGVRLVVDAAECRVEADEVLLRKAVTNLVLNSIEASAGGDGERGGEVRIVAGIEKALAFVKVSDSGPGIPEENLSRIFTPFFTTKPGGTGLGLALVQKIAVAHNGDVLVESRQGAGAAFTLRIPLRAELATSPAEWV